MKSFDSYRFPVTSKFVTMKSYRDLEIYKESKRFTIEVDKMTTTLPKFQLFLEGSQIGRFSKAVTTAIIEGYGRKRYKSDFIKSSVYSQSECDETIVRLDFVFETESLNDSSKCNQLKNGYDSLSKRINKFVQWVDDNWNDFTKPETGNL